MRERAEIDGNYHLFELFEFRANRIWNYLNLELLELIVSLEVHKLTSNYYYYYVDSIDYHST